MTIHLDPNADIIQQLNDLFPILSVKEVNVVVSEEQLKVVKGNIHCAAYWTDKDMPSDFFAVRIGAVQFNLTTSQQIGIDPIHLTTSQHFSGNRIRFNEENKMDLIETAKAYGIRCHAETNHLYDGKPYSIHLEAVYYNANRYKHLLLAFPDDILASAWTHDVIEDCRQTYNDVNKVCGKGVAEITYALSNEKGKTRKERANDAYYKGIRNTYGATFIKICDRIANVKYSRDNNSPMLDVYRREQASFRSELFSFDYNTMWVNLEELLS